MIICMDEDPVRVEEAAALVVKTVQNLGFACRVETVNAGCDGLGWLTSAAGVSALRGGRS